MVLEKTICARTPGEFDRFSDLDFCQDPLEFLVVAIRTMTCVKSIMGIIGTLAFGIFLFFTCWVLAAGCSRAHVFVSNRSGTTISNLVIFGSCKERRAETLKPQSEWLTVTPYTNGQMCFSFDCAGTRYNTNTVLQTGFVGVFYMVNSNMIVMIQRKS